jgi:hypothetical protein
MKRSNPTAVAEPNVLWVAMGTPGVFNADADTPNEHLESHSWLFDMLLDDRKEFRDLTLEGLVIRAIRKNWQLSDELMSEYERVVDGVDPYSALYPVACSRDGTPIIRRAKLYFRGMKLEDLKKIEEKAAKDREIDEPY